MTSLLCFLLTLLANVKKALNSSGKGVVHFVSKFGIHLILLFILSIVFHFAVFQPFAARRLISKCYKTFELEPFIFPNGNPNKNLHSKAVAALRTVQSYRSINDLFSNRHTNYSNDVKADFHHLSQLARLIRHYPVELSGAEDKLPIVSAILSDYQHQKPTLQTDIFKFHSWYESQILCLHAIQTAVDFTPVAITSEIQMFRQNCRKRALKGRIQDQSQSGDTGCIPELNMAWRRIKEKVDGFEFLLLSLTSRLRCKINDERSVLQRQFPFLNEFSSYLELRTAFDERFYTLLCRLCAEQKGESGK